MSHSFNSASFRVFINSDASGTAEIRVWEDDRAGIGSGGDCNAPGATIYVDGPDLLAFAQWLIDRAGGEDPSE